MEGRQGGPHVIYKFHNILLDIILNLFKRLDYVSPPNLSRGNKTYNSKGRIRGSSGCFSANIFEPGKTSEKILRSLSRKQQQKTSGPRTDGGERFQP